MFSERNKELDSSEILLWSVLRSLELQAFKQYEQNVRELAIPSKKALVDLLVARVPSDEALEAAEPPLQVQELLNSASTFDDVDTLIIEGLFLELLRQTIYQMFAHRTGVGLATREMCSLGLTASKAVRKDVPNLIRQKVGDGQQVLESFLPMSRPILRRLDVFGKNFDRHFGQRFGIRYADLMSEFVAELIPDCGNLGMDRLQVVAHLNRTLVGVW